MELGSFAHVSSFALKAENTPGLPDKEDVTSKLQCYIGLVEMESGRFNKAANIFIHLPFSPTNIFEVKFPHNHVSKIR